MSTVSPSPKNFFCLSPNTYLLEKPDPSDGNKLRLDKVWGMLYDEDFPRGDSDLEPDTQIIYMTEESRRKDQYVEQKYCYEINELEYGKTFQGRREKEKSKSRI